MASATPTLARRYSFKLLANMAAVPVYLLMEAILPRALGPAMYGNFSFATNLFQQLSGFLDMGTSTCFYNALSRRQGEHGLIAFYLRISLVVGLVTSLAGLCLLHPVTGQLLMPDVPLWLAPLAAVWAFLTWFGRVLRSMNDAIGATVGSELVRTAVSLVGVGCLTLLYVCDALNIGTLFAQQYAMLGATALGYWLVTHKSYAGRITLGLDRRTARAYGREFFDYSHPLFVQALLSFFMLTAERWLLQWFDGSHEQGMFALSQKVSWACFLFVSAMTPLLMRELSIAWGQKDKAAMARLVDRFAPLLYVVAAYFSCFTLVEAETLVQIFGGAAYAGAIVPVQIMALYPLHQGYGQLAGSIFHATGRTHILRNMAALECVYGLTCAWLLLAPPDMYGLHLGATGLALKTIGVQCLTVNAYLWLASRAIPLHFWRNLFHQVWSLCFLLGLAFAARELTLPLPIPAVDSLGISRFVASGILYSAGCAALILAFPPIVGMSRQDLRELWLRFRKR